ncbi:hypothetical protein OUZ56_003332 [Daphnia magna]|uniref:Uncharacterized protein n=1 Tax=Daphnia magna TaxID=35525 RepID=A0ABR0A8U7_9CRUS|nr:hypothetical protein OUZ56_003332 [Daphnia magna]
MGVYKPTVGELTAEEMLASLTLCIKPQSKTGIRGRNLCLKEESGAALVDYSTKYSILLPADQLLTQRIVWEYHMWNLHIKSERLLPDLRWGDRSHIGHCPIN